MCLDLNQNIYLSVYLSVTTLAGATHTVRALLRYQQKALDASNAHSSKRFLAHREHSSWCFWQKVDTSMYIIGSTQGLCSTLELIVAEILSANQLIIHMITGYDVRCTVILLDICNANSAKRSDT